MHPFCNLQNRAQTHAVLVIQLPNSLNHLCEFSVCFTFLYPDYWLTDVLLKGKNDEDNS